MNQSVLQQTLNQAMQLMQQNQVARALPLFNSLLQAGIKDPRLDRSIGVAYERLGQIQPAIDAFKRSLAGHAGQLDLCLSVARLSHKARLWNQAEEYYRKLVPDHQTPTVMLHYGYFNLEKPQPNYAAAVSSFNIAQQQPELAVQARVGIARAMIDLHRVDEAVQQLKEALALQPESLLAQRELVRCYRLHGQFVAAQQLLEPMLKHTDVKVVDYSILALCWLDQGDVPRAMSVIEQGLTKFPEARELLKLQASVRYELAHHDFTLGYANIPEPDMTQGHYHDWLQQLIDAEALDQARVVLQTMQNKFGDNAGTLSLAATLEYTAKNYATTIELISNSPFYRAQQPAALTETLALAALGEGDLTLAQSTIEQLLTGHSSDQFYWALQGTYWRLVNDERYFWLNRYDDLVKHQQIILPQGYANHDEFNQALIATLNELHKLSANPLEQSLKNGTQTSGSLLTRQEPVLQALAKSLQKTSEALLADLPYDAQHPTLAHAVRSLQFSASWSVSLREQGYHLAHVHPKGWYSSAYYVQLPSETQQQNEQQRAGWLHLGKPGIALATPLTAQRWIQPKAGTLALFPSFMWHGTEPFESDSKRMTVAFDLVNSDSSQLI